MSQVAVGVAIAVLAVGVAPAHGAIVLPDGRQWEMVSPPDKGGASIDAMDKEGGVAQAAAGGSALTWAASGPIGAEVAGNRAFEWSQMFSTRGADGWSTRDIAGAHEAATGLNVGEISEYKIFSSNLSLGLVEPKGETPLSPEATERTIYLRDTAGAGYVPLITAANVPEGVKFGGAPGEVALTIQFRGATSDLSHIVFSSREPGLTPGASPNSLYEWDGGRLELVAAEGSLGGGVGNVRNAISSDGSSVVFSTGVGTAKHRLYMRDMTKAETIQLDVAQGAREPAEAATQFQDASVDDHAVFFTDHERLTADSTATGFEPDLYVFETTNDADEPLKGTLTDLTANTNAGESADVQGLLPGASEDGSYVYLVAKGALTEAANAEGERAEPDADNLYMLHKAGPEWKEWTGSEWRDTFTTTFIARLSGDDENDWGAPNRASPELGEVTSRVAPNGRWLAFMSDRSLTGYDNSDANNGEVDDEQVYLYHVPENLGAEPGTLICVSCDPTGARPVGVQGTNISSSHPFGKLLVDESGLWNGHWLAANIPGWTPANLAGATFYQSRYLSNSGRLFFNSDDALVREDTNGTEDVYEYEPLGVGGCDGAVSASGSIAFKPAHTVAVEGKQGEEPAGCVGLISSGASIEESAFLDASENGEDVFFLTAAKLAPQDYDTSYDIYDAHECTANAPCVAPPAETSLPCTTPEACRAPSGPQPAIFGAPPSQTFSGTDNLTPVPTTTPKAKLKMRALTRAQKLTKALKACARRPRKGRPACKRSARRRYGATKQSSEGR